jgi:hypothetical protein
MPHDPKLKTIWEEAPAKQATFRNGPIRRIRAHKWTYEFNVQSRKTYIAECCSGLAVCNTDVYAAGGLKVQQ